MNPTSESHDHTYIHMYILIYVHIGSYKLHIFHLAGKIVLRDEKAGFMFGSV